jgi:hypothetical protein
VLAGHGAVRVADLQDLVATLGRPLHRGRRDVHGDQDVLDRIDPVVGVVEPERRGDAPDDAVPVARAEVVRDRLGDPHAAVGVNLDAGVVGRD